MHPEVGIYIISGSIAEFVIVKTRNDKPRVRSSGF
jgi:hypothetical protein